MLLYGLLQLLCKVTYFTRPSLREMLVEYWTDLCFDNHIDLELIVIKGVNFIEILLITTWPKQI